MFENIPPELLEELPPALKNEALGLALVALQLARGSHPPEKTTDAAIQLLDAIENPLMHAMSAKGMALAVEGGRNQDTSVLLLASYPNAGGQRPLSSLTDLLLAINKSGTSEKN